MCNVEGPPLKKNKPQPLSSTEPYPIYLDYNATTPLCHEGWQAMCGVHKVWGNPSSSHPYGLAARYALDEAREKVRTALHAPAASSVIFTSGGTESNNHAIIGGARSVHAAHPYRKYIISSNVEHPAVAEVLQSIRRTVAPEMEFRLAPVNSQTGCLDPHTLEQTLRHLPEGPQSVALVTIMFANNEIGSVNPVAELVRLTKVLCGPDCLFHTDAAQALGKVRVDVQETAVDLLSVCSHKFYGPKGVGALYIRPAVRPDPILYGAGHEGGLRPGTENVLSATGMAAALLFACANLEKFGRHMRETRDELLAVLRAELSKHNMDLIINGDLKTALPNTLNCAVFKRVPDKRADLSETFISAQRLIVAVGRQVCISAGSACHSTAGDAEIEISSPLKAVGVHLNRAIGTLRISTGRETTMDDVRRAARIIARQAAHQFAE